MCGIAGIMTREGMVVSEKLLDMLDLIQHRGPDAAGIAYFSKKSYNGNPDFVYRRNQETGTS